MSQKWTSLLFPVQIFHLLDKVVNFSLVQWFGRIWHGKQMLNVQAILVSRCTAHFSSNCLWPCSRPSCRPSWGGLLAVETRIPISLPWFCSSLWCLCEWGQFWVSLDKVEHCQQVFSYWANGFCSKYSANGLETLAVLPDFKQENESIETQTNQGSHSEALCEFGQHKESRFTL